MYGVFSLSTCLLVNTLFLCLDYCIQSCNEHGAVIQYLLCTFEGFPSGSVVKTLPDNAGDVGSISGLGTSPGGGDGHPLQYSCLENPITKEPHGLQSTGSQRNGYNLAIEHALTHTLCFALF